MHLRITKKKDHIIFNYQLGPNIISSFKEEKDLGKSLSNNLTWRCHILTKVNTSNPLRANI